MKKLANKLPENHREKWFRASVIGAIITLVVILAAVFAVRYTYSRALRPVSDSQKITLVTVPNGASMQQIAEDLKTQGLIRHSWAFEWYVRSNGLVTSLKAGTYALTPNQTVGEIVTIIARGEVATDLVTILPGQRLDQIEAALINNGFTPSDVKTALNPNIYKDHPALVDKPKEANLEGYLYPETFQKTADTKAQDIVRASLDEMQKRLTPTVRAGIAKKGLSVHEGITLASIVEKEVSNPADRKIVAGVFLNRLQVPMRLESDVTAFYGAYLADADLSVGYDSPYNTYLYDGLPIGPISNISEVSLMAVITPTKSDYLYFVAGDNGNTYYGKSIEEHNENVAKYCHELCR